MRECIGDSQIQSCGCAERRFAAGSGLLCDTLRNCTTGVKTKFKLPENEYRSISARRSKRIVTS